MGTALDEVLKEAKRCSDFARKMHENLAINATVYRRLVSTLTGRNEGFSRQRPISMMKAVY